MELCLTFKLIEKCKYEWAKITFSIIQFRHRSHFSINARLNNGRQLILQCVKQNGFFKLENIQVAKKKQKLNCSVINFKQRLKMNVIFFNPLLQARRDLAICLSFI